ncbi:hypothetical protein F4802DRAFT_599924 [Xylaria palmicola]|nr:hypothetical protein F4802DRAFT_599924 [Xylaria palmicola]
MAASIPDPVTIDRAYFETLVRRAHYSNDGPDALPFASTNETIVPVSKEEYENLLLLARQFANLKRSLLGAGVTEENIATLVQDATGVPQIDPDAVVTHPYSHNQNEGLGVSTKQGGYPTTSQAASYTTSYSATAIGTARNLAYFNGGSKPYTFEENHDWSSHENLGSTLTPSCSADGPPDVLVDSTHQNSRPLSARMCRRTILLCALPPFTTLGDVTGVVRGGQLLDIFLRSAEHIASVSFLREGDAVRFHEHSRKNDIYIRNKRVFVKWADRHFILPGHVANKVAAGASRNLILRRCGAHHTEDSVREDLEHIHNLIVVKVEFIGGSCYIKTNSVHNAMYARTCMMSRAKYKGSKIEWDVDECSLPLEAHRKLSTKLSPQGTPPTKLPVRSARNRFDMLRLDDDDNESDDKFDTSSEMPSTVDVTA